MTRLSIIIPAVVDVAQLERTLLSVLENRPADSEIVVVLATRYDDPYNLCGEVRFVTADRHDARSGSVAHGFGVSHGQFVHFLACGAEVVADWADSALAWFDDPTVGSVASPLVETIDGDRRLINAGWRYTRGGDARPVGSRLPWAQLTADDAPNEADAACSLAAFYRSTALGSLEPGCSLSIGQPWADLDLGLRLQRFGLRTVIEPQAAVFVAADELPRSGPGLRSGWQAERLFWEHAGNRGWTSLAAHVGLLGSEAVASLTSPARAAQLMGRGAGLVSQLWTSRRAADEAVVSAAAESASIDSGHRRDQQHATPSAPTTRSATSRRRNSFR